MPKADQGIPSSPSISLEGRSISASRSHAYEVEATTRNYQDVLSQGPNAPSCPKNVSKRPPRKLELELELERSRGVASRNLQLLRKISGRTDPAVRQTEASTPAHFIDSKRSRSHLTQLRPRRANDYFGSRKQLFADHHLKQPLESSRTASESLPDGIDTGDGAGMQPRGIRSRSLGVHADRGSDEDEARQSDHFHEDDD
jgi:hypothetical protein